ncbi:MAG: FG-GAP-like repeat-containing protein, partial [Lacunisphaera sp.]
MAVMGGQNYEPYGFTTLAGAADDGVISADGTGAAARFNNPYGVAVDASGQIYIADNGNFTIRKITPAGVVTTLAGSPGESGSVDGIGSAARFFDPVGLAVDNAGNVFVVDNDTVRKITPAGVVTTIAGAAGVSGWDDGAANLARFSSPCGIAVDGAGNIYLADSGNDGIRKISFALVVTTLAGPGRGGNQGNVDGNGNVARFFYPDALTVDADGNVYVADTGNNSIRKITPSGDVSTLAGIVGITGGIAGSADGAGSDARFSFPEGIAVDGSGNVYVTDASNNTIRRVTGDGNVTTLAGSAVEQAGNADALGVLARFYAPAYLAINSSGSLYVTDRGNGTIRMVSTSNGMVTTVAGESDAGKSVDGPLGLARFNVPRGLTFDPSGNLFVADSENNTIRKITPAGVVSTFAGAAQSSGAIDGVGGAARFNSPAGMGVDASGNLYVADCLNNTIRKVTPAGAVTTFAGVALNRGSADGVAGDARFSSPYGIAVDLDGNVYVSDTNNHNIRKITPGGTVTTVAGMAGVMGSADGLGAAARFSYPAGLTVDANGNLFVADSYNFSVRKISPNGWVTTLAGSAANPGSADGTGGNASFSFPDAVAVDNSGNVFVADSGNDTIRKISPSGLVTTVGGTVGVSGSQDGLGSAALFTGVYGLAVDGSGLIYVSDSTNNTIRVGTATSIYPLSVAASKPLGDFDGDGKADLVWTNTVTGERSMWLMDGSGMKAGASLGVVPVEWVVSATADFDGDGKADIFWTNTVTGDRAIWLMDGSSMRLNTFMGTVSADWVISGTGDFDGDGKQDLVWTNTTTGDRAMWLMNGNAVKGGGYLGTVPVAWQISGVGDFDGDGKADLLWS